MTLQPNSSNASTSGGYELPNHQCLVRSTEPGMFPPMGHFPSPPHYTIKQVWEPQLINRSLCTKALRMRTLLQLFPCSYTKRENLSAMWNPVPCQKRHMNPIRPMEERKEVTRSGYLKTNKNLVLLVSDFLALGPFSTSKVYTACQ